MMNKSKYFLIKFLNISLAVLRNSGKTLKDSKIATNISNFRIIEILLFPLMFPVI